LPHTATAKNNVWSAAAIVLKLYLSWRFIKLIKSADLFYVFRERENIFYPAYLARVAK